jgi:uncharacterized membrane protein YhaH (DUF805 family)
MPSVKASSSGGAPCASWPVALAVNGADARSRTGEGTMGFGEAVRTGFHRYVDFSGRASRSEYWWWALFNFLVWLAAVVLDAVIFPGSGRYGTYFGLLSGIASLALFLPNLAVGVRRLHDTDRSGWWLLISVIPIIGWVVLLIFLVSSGTPGANRFGPPPAGARALPNTDFRPQTPGAL